MLSWLKRKKHEATQKSDREWTVATGEDSGFPLILRIRSSLPLSMDRSRYTTLLTIHWDYQPSADNGMPSAQERTRMEQFEDLLHRGLESSNQSCLTAIVTCNGVREWQWYARNPQEAISCINSSLSRSAPFPIQISAQADPDWSAYYRLLSSTMKGSS